MLAPVGDPVYVRLAFHRNSPFLLHCFRNHLKLFILFAEYLLILEGQEKPKWDRWPYYCIHFYETVISNHVGNLFSFFVLWISYYRTIILKFVFKYNIWWKKENMQSTWTLRKHLVSRLIFFSAIRIHYVSYFSQTINFKFSSKK